MTAPNPLAKIKTVDIRQYQSKDTPEVKQLIRSILNQEFHSASAAYPETDLDRIPEIYGGPREGFFVALENGKIVGTCAVKEESKHIALLRRLFVDPKFRKLGIGSQLVDEAAEFARGHGYQRMIFRSTSSMVQANKLLSKKGFSELERLAIGPIEIIRFVSNL